MSANPPAAAWYRHVTEAIALRGWSKQELSDRSGVARSTIDGWQRNPRRPQAKSVNAVADVLGTDRARALQLAGIVGEPQPEPSIPRDILAAVRRSVAPDDQARVLDAIERTLRGEPQSPPPTAPDAAQRERRRAG